MCYVYLPVRSVCGFHTKPGLGHSGIKQKGYGLKQTERGKINVSQENPASPSFKQTKAKYC